MMKEGPPPANEVRRGPSSVALCFGFLQEDAKMPGIPSDTFRKISVRKSAPKNDPMF